MVTENTAPNAAADVEMSQYVADRTRVNEDKIKKDDEIISQFGDYNYGWHDSDAAGEAAKRGIDENVVRAISADKGEPQCTPYPEADAKNLFVRDDKKKNFYLITVRGDKRVNLKEFRKANGTRPLSFASAENLMDIMGLIPGAVTPLGILNDTEKKVHFYLDKHFLEEPGLVGVHPNDNTATVWLKTEDLIRIIEEHEHDVTLVSLD